jgi:hypothetical protein
MFSCHGWTLLRECGSVHETRSTPASYRRYVGDYKVNGAAIIGKGKIVLHTAIPNVPTIFGDVTGAFGVELSGVIGNQRIEGSMRRPDMPAIALPIVLIFREKLP